MNRVKDSRKTIYSFFDSFLVKCPHCNSLAIVTRSDRSKKDIFAARKFSCKICGAAKDNSNRNIISISENKDPYFNYSLWLSAPCSNNILWAYNLEHLNFIEEFVRGKLRETPPDPIYGYSNQSLFSRLPKWIQSRKNRDKILKVIEKMKQSVPF